MSAINTSHYFKPCRRLPTMQTHEIKMGKKIGLLGGSFNPAHAGHRVASLLAMKHYGLDEVWWLVIDKNPLKEKPNMATAAVRAAAAKKIARHPRVKIKTLPHNPRYQFTYHAVRHILARHRKNKFAFIMGSDCWHQFHRWYRYRGIASMVPLIIIGRAPTAQLYKKPRAAMFIKTARRCPSPLNHLASSQL